MMDFLVYSAKVSVLIVAFYTFYRLLLSRETFHRVNRIVLLSTALLSFLLPLCIITYHCIEEVESVAFQPTYTSGYFFPQLPPVPDSVAWWKIILEGIYLAGVAFVLCKILMSLSSVLHLIHSAQDVRDYQGHKVIVMDRETASFSWMNYLIIGRDDFERGVTEILDHESAHVALCHSWDVLLVDLISAIQWFNPAVWLLRADLRALHEYEADEVVLRKGVNAKSYQYLLISKALETSGFSITNQFNHSKLKNRINMMTKKKSSRKSIWKVLYVLPIVALSLAASAKTVYEYVYVNSNEPENPSTMSQDSLNIVIKDNVMSLIVNGKELISKNPGELMDVIAQYKDKPAVVNIEVYEKELQPMFDSFREICRNNHLLKINVKPLSKPVVIECDSIPEIGVASSDEPVEKKPDVLPEYPGGSEALYAFIAKNIHYPKIAIENGYQAKRVFAKFVVEKDGSIKEVSAFVPSENDVFSLYPSETPKDADSTLLIVNGKPFEGPISSIKKEEIESMTVLKNEASKAKYGERGKNGVIVIATKNPKDFLQKDDQEMHDACKKAFIEEVTRVVFQMPKWKPGEKNGKKVRTEFIMPVVFRLN